MVAIPFRFIWSCLILYEEHRDHIQIVSFLRQFTTIPVSTLFCASEAIESVPRKENTKIEIRMRKTD